MLVRLMIGLDPPDLRAIYEEFPDIAVTVGAKEPFPGEPCYTIHTSDWQAAGFDLRAADAEMAARFAEGRASLCVIGPPAASAAVGIEALTRAQRFIDRRNRASRGEPFDQVLRVHRALHDLTKPLVRADYEHALDTWQWMLRLFPGASLEVQVAALFHDIERLASEADARIEHRAPSYQVFKDAHARRGARMTEDALAGAGLGRRSLSRIAELIEVHERSGRDPELALLNDADALSFFSLNSAGFLAYFGPSHTRLKVDYTLRRLRPEARARLRRIRVCPDIQAMMTAATGGDWICGD